MNGLTYAIGCMSGTSMDGIDVALLATDGQHQVAPIAHLNMTYDPAFQSLLRSLEYTAHHCQGQDIQAHYPTLFTQFLEENRHLKRADMAQYLYQDANHPIAANDIIAHSTECHATLIANLREAHPYPVSVIGYHGQTVYHDPSTLSLQVGNPQVLANQTGIPVVFNFRQKDIEHGGQGAPLAPLYHQALAISQQLELPLGIINCGGIANITAIYDHDPESSLAYDTGPGNNLLDHHIRGSTKGALSYDHDGALGKKGRVHHDLFPDLIQTCFKAPSFISRLGPKSLDRHDLRPPALSHLSLEDAAATLAAFSAHTIRKGIDLLPTPPKHWLLAGGGWYNPCIKQAFIDEMADAYPKAKIATAEEHGLNNQAIEAELFAYLAVRRVQKRPTTYPALTGAAQPLVTGELFQPGVSLNTV